MTEEEIKKALDMLNQRPKGIVPVFADGEWIDINYDFNPPRVYKNGKFLGKLNNEECTREP